MSTGIDNIEWLAEVLWPYLQGRLAEFVTGSLHPGDWVTKPQFDALASAVFEVLEGYPLTVDIEADYVPYSGATGDVDLGSYGLQCGDLNCTSFSNTGPWSLRYLLPNPTHTTDAQSGSPDIINVVSTMGFPSVGYILLDNNYLVRYTGTTATSFTNCVWGDFDSGDSYTVGDSVKLGSVLTATDIGSAPGAVSAEQMLLGLRTRLGTTTLVIRADAGNAELGEGYLTLDSGLRSGTSATRFGVFSRGASQLHLGTAGATIVVGADFSHASSYIGVVECFWPLVVSDTIWLPAVGDTVGDPLVLAGHGKLYSKTVSGITELFYLDSAGQVIQLTSNGLVGQGADMPQIIFCSATLSSGAIQAVAGGCWPTSAAILKQIIVNTVSTDWDLELFCHSSGSGGLFDSMTLVGSASGAMILSLDLPYLDSEEIDSVYLRFTDNVGAATASVSVLGLAAESVGSLVVSGTLSPDVTGTYRAMGLYNGKPYYRLADGTDSWYIWYLPDETNWFISSAPGDIGWPNPVPWWEHVPYEVPEGEYSPQGTATGIATVT